jgi:hypothetical protein
MTDDEHKVCDLEKQVAVLKQQALDAATALVLARDVSSARWASGIAVIFSLIGLLISLLRR